MRNAEAHGEVFSTAREVVDFINASSITRNDIVAILPIGGQLFLIYFA